MASQIHAGISSSIQANPPETPPYIQTSPMGNFISYRCLLLLSLRSLVNFLFIFPFLLHYCCTAVMARVQWLVMRAAKGEL